MFRIFLDMNDSVDLEENKRGKGKKPPRVRRLNCLPALRCDTDISRQ